MFDTNEIRTFINLTLKNIDLYSRNAEEQIFFTGAVESLYTEIIQGRTPNGTARSFWQVEPRTGKDICDNYWHWKRKGYYAQKIIKHCYLPQIKGFNYEDHDYSIHVIDQLLTTNIYFALAMARLKYLRTPRPLPDHNDPRAMAEYHKQYFNTAQGETKIEKSIQTYKYVLNQEAQ